MLWLLFIGFGASVFGSMVGLGGGFIVVPILRIFLNLPPAEAAGTSLALVITNSGSGALTYLLQRRVHLRTGWYVGAGALPGSVLGAIAVKHASPRLFDWLFAVLLIAVSADIFLNRNRRRPDEASVTNAGSLKGLSWPSALGVGFTVGFISSLFGVGGGVILVPSLLYFSDLPAHAVSATSHFGIILTSPLGFVTHVVQHDIRWNDAVPLAIGGVLGGPIGARLSLRIKSQRLLVLVAVALTLAAAALVFRHIIG